MNFEVRKLSELQFRADKNIFMKLERFKASEFVETSSSAIKLPSRSILEKQVHREHFKTHQVFFINKLFDFFFRKPGKNH